MRKAHQNEVQREVNRFKQEFLRKFNSENKEQIESLAAYKEEKELEEVRQEILSLSEKYSQKCVEAISLEEKLRNSQQKLRHAHQVIQNYEMKSKNLRSSPDEIESQPDSLCSKPDDVSRKLSMTSHSLTELFLCFQNQLIETINLKPDSLPTPSASRDEPKEAIINLPLIPIIKVKTEMHPRSKLNDGETLKTIDAIA